MAQAVGARTRGDWSQDPATRTFQALRIFVNRELSELALTLPRIVPLLDARRPARGDQLPFARGPDREALLRIARRSRSAATRASRGCRSRTAALPGAPLALVGRAIRPGDAEVAANPRSRSATLRVAERTAHPLPRRLRRRAAAVNAAMVRLNLLLLAVLVVCALSLVTSRHQARKLFVELEREQASARATRSSTASCSSSSRRGRMPARVEKIAREQLRMQLPGRGRVEVVAGGGAR